MVKPVARRKAASHLRVKYHISGRRASKLLRLHRSTMRYQSRRRDCEPLRVRLRELAATYPRYGYRMLTDKLHQEGRVANHKRVDRIYRKEGLQLSSVMK